MSRSPLTADAGVDPRAVGRKVAWRILPLIFLLYIVSYLDRANVAFAKLQMSKLPGFTEDVFGWGFGIFFVGYLLLEIPGALLVEHWSARKWFARILITWGFCSAAMALVRTPMQFYVARFLLGLAEAGFFPGVLVYLTHWFPRADRGRAMAGLVLAVPVSLVLGAVVSGALLEVRGKVLGYEVAGWQWMFLAEGLPAVMLGFAVPFLLTDRPGQARWLRPAERAWLEGELAAERREAEAAGGVTLGQALLSPTVWLLALGILATNTGGYALSLWLPTAVKSFLVESRGQAGDFEVLLWTCPVYAAGVVGVWLSGWLTDRTGERKWQCFVGQVCTGACLACSVVPGQSWPAVFTWLCLAGFFALVWPPPFWVLPTLTLSSSAAAVSLGFINICANVSGLIGNPIVGTMKAAGFDDRACFLFLASCYALGAAFISAVRVPRKSPAAAEADEPLPEA
jgi:ACS family tartrate transporter-like MFS transporter